MLGQSQRELEITRAGRRGGERNLEGYHLQEPGRAARSDSVRKERERGRESKTLGSPSVICNYTNSY